jgi:phage gpG-like protein
MSVKVDGWEGLEKLFDHLNDVYDGAAEPIRNHLKETMTDLEADHKAFFDEAQDKHGSPWAPLAPYTIQRKGHDTILIETGALVKSLTQKGAMYAIREFFATGGEMGIIFGTSRPHAVLHMTGTSRMPARPMVGLTEDRIDKFQQKIGDIVIDELIKTDFPV